MSGSAATIISALIGAVIGSLGSIYLEARYRERKERREKRNKIVKKYLYQLQDALEALWYRLDNLEHRGGREIMEDTYFDVSTLYILGRVIAYRRILMIDGVYPDLIEINGQFGAFLRGSLKELERLMKGFHKYDRLSLVDTLIERKDNYSNIRNYLAFKRDYEEDRINANDLLPARQFLSTLSGETAEKALSIISEAVKEISEETKIPPEIPKNACEVITIDRC